MSNHAAGVIVGKENFGIEYWIFNIRNRSRVQRFRVQGSAQPLASEAASLIEKETAALRSLIREVVRLHQI